MQQPVSYVYKIMNYIGSKFSLFMNKLLL